METKKCPYCGEEIAATAKKCKHCGEWVEKPDNKLVSSYKSYSERSKELYERWLDFSGVSDKQDMICMNINLILFFFIFAIPVAIVQSITDDEEFFIEYLAHRPIMCIIIAGLLLRSAVIPWISCVWRYIIVSTYHEVKEEMDQEQDSERLSENEE